MKSTIPKHAAAILVIAALLAVPPASLAQTAQATQNNWAAVQSLKSNAKVVVMTKDGVETKGKLQSVSEASITIGRGRNAKDLKRESVAVIFAKRKSLLKSTLIGTSVGYGTGAVVGLTVARCKTGEIFCVGTGEAIGMAGPLVAIPGALAGFLIGESRSKRVLVYSAKP